MPTDSSDTGSSYTWATEALKQKITADVSLNSLKSIKKDF